LTRLGCKRALLAMKSAKAGGHIKGCYRVKQAAFVPEQNSKLGVANACGLLKHRLENWLQFARRIGDDTQDLRGRCQLRERFVALMLEAIKFFW
jgi:hypothetical protein